MMLAGTPGRVGMPVKPVDPIRVRPIRVGRPQPVRPVRPEPVRPIGNPRVLGSFEKGGDVEKTGVYKLHKGEKVVPKSKVQTVSLGKKGKFKVRKGALHRALGIPEGEKIGQARISSALHSSKPSVRRMAASAKGLTHMGHK
jgi:hypothetical protein